MICCFLSCELSPHKVCWNELKSCGRLVHPSCLSGCLRAKIWKILPMNIRVIHSHVGQRCDHDPITPTALKTDWYKLKCIYSHFEANLTSLFPSLAISCVARFTLSSWRTWIVVIYVTRQILTQNTFCDFISKILVSKDGAARASSTVDSYLLLLNWNVVNAVVMAANYSRWYFVSVFWLNCVD